MIFFIVFFIVAGILVNIKGFKIKTTLYVVLFFLIALILYIEFPLLNEVAAWSNHPVEKKNGVYEIDLSFQAEHIDFSAPAELTDINGKPVSSDLQPGKYRVSYDEKSGDLLSTAYVSTASHKKLLAFVFAFVAAWLAIVQRFARKLSVEKLFLLFVIPLGILYLVLFPTGAIPDARAHFMATYRFSNIILGSPEWAARADDAFYYQNCWQHHANTAVYYRVLESNFHFLVQDNTLVMLEPWDNMTFYSFISYLPQLIGIIIGRLLRLGTIPMLYLSRILILTTYVLIIYRAIKKAPSGKHILFVIAIVPVSLMYASSISYDTMLIIASIAYISAVLNESFIEIIVWAFLLGSIKGGGMLVLIPLVLLLKDKLKVIFAFVSSIVSVILFNWILPKIALFQFGTEGNGKYTALYAIKEPLQFFKMSLRAYIQEADHLFGDAFGSRLSWLIYAVPIVFVGALFVLGWIMATHENDQKQVMNRKWVWYIPIVLSVVLTPVMLLSSTPIGESVIHGLQGRYYLPILIPVLFLIAKQNLYTGENQVVLNKCYQWTAVISAICICYAARMVFTTIPTW